MTLTIASHNIASKAKSWQRRTFAERLQYIGHGVGYYTPAVLAVQEAGSTSELRRLDPELRRHGMHRAPKGGRWRYLYFNPDLVKLHDSGLFALNATRTKHAAWGKFTDRASGQTLFITSVHLSVGGEEKAQTRYREAERLLKLSRQVNAFHHPEVHAGDFNSYRRVGDVVMEPSLFVDALDVAHGHPKSAHLFDTFNGRTTVTPHPSTQLQNGRHDDHLYVDHKLRNAVTWWSQRPTVLASDHNIIAAKLELR